MPKSIHFVHSAAQFEPDRNAAFAAMPITILFNGQSDQTSWIIGTADQKNWQTPMFFYELRKSSLQTRSENLSQQIKIYRSKKSGPLERDEARLTQRQRHVSAAMAKSNFESIETRPAAAERT